MRQRGIFTISAAYAVRSSRVAAARYRSLADAPHIREGRGVVGVRGLQLGQVDLAHVQDIIACGGVGHEFGDVVGDDLP